MKDKCFVKEPIWALSCIRFPESAYVRATPFTSVRHRTPPYNNEAMHSRHTRNTGFT